MSRNSFNRRSMLQVGAMAGGLAIAGLAGPIGGVLAQEATTPVGLAAQTTPVTGAAAADPRVARYQAFVDAFAANLGMPSGEVEQALRDTMKSMVDEAVAAGEVSAAEAEAIKQQIDEADALPMFGGAGAPVGGQDGRGGRGGGRGEYGEEGGSKSGWSDDYEHDSEDDSEDYDDDSDDEGEWMPQDGSGESNS